MDRTESIIRFCKQIRIDVNGLLKTISERIPHRLRWMISRQEIGGMKTILLKKRGLKLMIILQEQKL